MRDRRQCPLVWVMAHNIKLLALYAQHKWTMHTRNLLFLFLCFLFVFSFSFHQVYNERVLLEHYKLHWGRSGAIGNRNAPYLEGKKWCSTTLIMCIWWIEDQFGRFSYRIKILIWIIEWIYHVLTYFLLITQGQATIFSIGL